VKVNSAGEMSKNDRNVANVGAASSAALFSSTDSKEHVDLAMTWLTDCLESHADCEFISRPLPTRLIYIAPSSNGTPEIKLVETKGYKDWETRYVAFSHCWGASQTYCLLDGKDCGVDCNKDCDKHCDRYKSALISIDFSKLSKNSQDAIRICQALSLSFI